MYYPGRLKCFHSTPHFCSPSSLIWSKCLYGLWIHSKCFHGSPYAAFKPLFKFTLTVFLCKFAVKQLFVGGGVHPPFKQYGRTSHFIFWTRWLNWNHACRYRDIHVWSKKPIWCLRCSKGIFGGIVQSTEEEYKMVTKLLSSKTANQNNRCGIDYP